MRIGLSGPAPRSPYYSVLLIIALFLLAVALGNIVKEIAFALRRPGVQRDVAIHIPQKNLQLFYAVSTHHRRRQYRKARQ
jgi:hypothetical protein